MLAGLVGAMPEMGRGPGDDFPFFSSGHWRGTVPWTLVPVVRW